MAVELREFAFLRFVNQIAHSSSNNTQLCFKLVWLLNDTFAVKFCFFPLWRWKCLCQFFQVSRYNCCKCFGKDQPSFALSKHGLIGCLGCQGLSDPFKGNQSHMLAGTVIKKADNFAESNQINASSFSSFFFFSYSISSDLHERCHTLSWIHTQDQFICFVFPPCAPKAFVCKIKS